MAGVLYPIVQIADALNEHKAVLVSIREQCKAEIELDPSQFNDDLFLLRFAVEHKGDLQKCVTGVKAAIKFRFENHELLSKLGSGEMERHPDEVLMAKYQPFGLHGETKDGSPIFFGRPGISNLDRLMKDLTPTQIRNAIIFSKERPYQICDKYSREKGYLVRVVAVSSFKGLSLSNMNKKFMELSANSMKEVEALFPYMLAAIVATNPGTMMKVAMGMMKVFNPEAGAKMRTCGAKSTVTGKIQDCPFAPQLFDVQATEGRCRLSSHLGGSCTCRGQGCLGVPNDSKIMVDPK